MLSRADVRKRVEWALRAVVIASLAVMLWLSMNTGSGEGARSIDSKGLSGNALVDWSTTATAPGEINLALDSVPAATDRAWLAALAGAGSKVSWRGRLAPVMIDAAPIADPNGGTSVLIAASTVSRVTLSDEIGLIDSLRPQNSGASIELPTSPAHITAHASGTTASTVQPDSIILRRVMVIGSAGWETKFLAAALEEEGWKVDALIKVAPGLDVTSPSQAPLDTSRYSAVIAIDSAAVPYANRITDFVRAGGGVVLESDAAALGAFASLRASSVGEDIRPSGSSANSTVTESLLPVRPLASLRPDAVALQRTRGVVSVAVRRFGSGRVLQLGVLDSWRLRLNGGDDGVREHRRFWTRLLSSVAYAPIVTKRHGSKSAASSGTTSTSDPAPFADLVAKLGTAAAASARHGVSHGAPPPSPWLFLLFAAALLGEVASRRTRGAA